MNTKHYYIGKTYLQLCLPEEMQMPENLGLFQVEEISEGEVCVTYTLEFTNQIMEKAREAKEKQEGTKVVNRENLHVFQTAAGECRFIRHFGATEPFGISMQTGKQQYHVWVTPETNELMIYDAVFNSLLSLEKHMIRREAMILHSAYMCYHGMAVLFSAPSETGKSTQAALWEKYRGTRTINGDRSLLYKHEDGWYAHGWPICGSSEICQNEAYKIKAIVMLRQAKENTIRPLKGIEALKQIMSQITINYWDTSFQMKAMDLIEDLMKEIPVYELGCDISEQAVECLEKVLK